MATVTYDATTRRLVDGIDNLTNAELIRMVDNVALTSGLERLLANRLDAAMQELKRLEPGREGALYDPRPTWDPPLPTKDDDEIDADDLPP